MMISKDFDFNKLSDDGVSSLPKASGIYAIWNNITKKFYIGRTKNIYIRCRHHRSRMRSGNADNIAIRLDVQKYGTKCFFYFVFELIGMSDEKYFLNTFKERELFWALQFNACDERYGYNLDAGGLRSRAARFRDRECKLMRSRKYCMLSWINKHDPIDIALLNSWLPGN